MPEPEIKRFRAQLKLAPDGAEGTVVALFSVFNMIDDDGDVVMPSFFTDGQPIKMAAWGHDWDTLPPGRGVVRVTQAGAEFHGAFFLDSTVGRDHWVTVKGLAELQEWSFGYRVLKSEAGTFDGQPCRYLIEGEVFEASPVFVGANRQTMTLAIKAGAGEEGRKVSAPGKVEHKYMDRWLAQAAFADPLEGSYEDVIEDLEMGLGAVLGVNDPYGYCPTAVIGTFPDYCIAVSRHDGEFEWWRVPYTIDADGDPVPGTPVRLERAFTELPAGAEEMSAEKSATYTGHAVRLVAAADRFVKRTNNRIERRSKAGRVLSQANRDMLTTLEAALRSGADGLLTLLESTAPKTDDAGDDEEGGKASGLALRSQFEALRFRRVAHMRGA